ncbi:cyclic nucleotide-binding domain-containing protein [Sphingomonas sp. RB56-2]|uniref:Cyclic nucleotide-binding domain-containing protein n=1 Tax=Sphingomonas brevis TaxID=2908206 RepID=A0ABT0S9G6_9SPHN|nr:cyclic nucleotide-binding domain-containing protein [Sphingomonas brevis]MCL6740782.1 cyclic nucleotide-binding domain-containing protein [Sphingomonas brevis]
MTLMLGLYIVIFAGALGALLVRSRLASHVMLGIAGVAGLAYGASAHGLLGSILPFLILIVAGVQATSGLVANRAAKFNADEQGMLGGPLAGLGRAQARRLIDQGIWMDGRPGDVLIREGEEAAQLYYLADGGAEVHVKGKLVGKANPGQLVGEATVLGETAAIATVTLSQPTRFWCAQGRALNAYLAANPDARHALEHGFNVSLREKLEAMNRAAG